MNQLGKLMARKKEYHEVFLNEVINLVFRANVKIQTQYYCISMINGLDFNSDSMKQKVLQIYVKLFLKIIEGDADKLQESKILSQILRGANRIIAGIDRSQLNLKFLDKEVDKLYALVNQTGNLKIKIQTLLFIYQIYINSNNLIETEEKNERYYDILYELIFDKNIQQSSLNELWFDLLFYSIKQDSDQKRVKAFIKRLLQSSVGANPGYIITCLIFVSNVLREHPGIKAMFIIGEDSLNDDEKGNYYYNKKAEQSNADLNCLWEVNLLQKHFHPSVQKFASDLLEIVKSQKEMSIEYNGNPFLDFSLANFLERLSLKKYKMQQKD